MTLPIKINLDGNRLLQEENISNYASNANYSTESNSIHNEYGFIELERTNNIKVIGWKKIFDNQIIICSEVKNNDLYSSEIAILKGNNYSVIIRDNITEGVSFGFTEDNLIQIEAKLNINKEIIIYFVDGYNSDKFLNISNLQVELDSDLRILNIDEYRNMIGFRLNTDANIYLENTDTGGSLYSGVYYVLATFWNKGGLKSHSLIVSNPIPIASTNAYTDGLPAGTLTSRRILVSLKVDEIEDGYDFYTIYCISKINQTLKAYQIITGDVPVADFTVDISSLNASSEVTPDSIVLNSSDYISSLTLTQVDDVLFKGNLKSSEEFDFQTYINNIQIDYISKEIDLSNIEENYSNSVLCFYDKSFTYDEVYALYASLIIEENGIKYETKAYHIPGREAITTIQGKLENDLINNLSTELPIYDSTDSNVNCPLNQIKVINSNAKIFQGYDTAGKEGVDKNMAYWENSNEFYSNENKWYTRDENDNITNDFRGQNVRHHRFPSAYTDSTSIPKMITGASTVNILGFKASNIVIPIEWQSKVQKIKFYYAKRDLNNRLILGQSLSIPQHQRHRFEWPVEVDQTIYSATGSFYIQDIFMEDPFSNDFPGEGFTPTNISRNLFDGTIYNYGITENTSLQPPGEYCFSDRIRQPWSKNSGYITMHPFDAMINNTNLRGTYLKNICRIKSKYTTGSYAFGSSWPVDQLPWVYSYGFNTQSNYYGIDRGEQGDPDNYYYNQIRRINNTQFYANTFLETQGGGYWSKYCEDRIVVEFPDRLLSGTDVYDANTPGQDFAILCLQDPTTVYIPVGIYGDGYASPYLTNMCAYKEDVFLSFDNQILCSTGFTYDIVSGEVSSVYGGDTFTSFYGERTTIDFDPLFRHPAGVSATAQTQQLRTTHYYICQSTSNIRLRYEGTNSWELYFPKSSLDTIPSTYSNYYGYNIDYSSVNDILQPTQELNRLDNDTNIYPNRIIKSQVNNPELIEDNYLIFNSGDVQDVGLQYGQIENLFNINNRLAIHLTNDLMLTMNKQTMDTSTGKAYIGSGDIFSVKPQDVNSNFYGGTVGRYSGTMTPYGYFYIDPLSYSVFNFDGNKLNVVSSEGLDRYFFNYSNFEFPAILNNYNDKFINDYIVSGPSTIAGWIVRYGGAYWKALIDTNSVPGVTEGDWLKINLPEYDIRNSVGGLGFTVSYDTKYDRVIFSKRDFTVNKFLIFNYTGIYRPTDTSQHDTYITYNNQIGFLSLTESPNSIVVAPGLYFTKANLDELVEDESLVYNGFTLGYYPKLKAWVSFYSYRPELLIGGSQNMFSSKNETIYEHNQKTSPYFYNSDEIQWFVEPLYKMNGSERLMSIRLKTEKTYYSKYLPLVSTLSLNQYIKQSETFDSYFVYNKNQMSTEKNFINTETSRDVEGYFNLNDFRDFTIEPNPILFELFSFDKIVKTDNLDSNKHWSKQRKFVDFWQSARFTKSLSEFVDLGTHELVILDDISYIEIGGVEAITIKSIIKLSNESTVAYATIDNYVDIFSLSSDTYKLRYILGSTPLEEGTYTVEVFNGYNLSLLDTQANKKQSFR